MCLCQSVVGDKLSFNVDGGTAIAMVARKKYTTLKLQLQSLEFVKAAKAMVKEEEEEEEDIVEEVQAKEPGIFSMMTMRVSAPRRRSLRQDVSLKPSSSSS